MEEAELETLDKEGRILEGNREEAGQGENRRGPRRLLAGLSDSEGNGIFLGVCLSHSVTVLCYPLFDHPPRHTHFSFLLKASPGSLPTSGGAYQHTSVIPAAGDDSDRRVRNSRQIYVTHTVEVSLGYSNPCLRKGESQELENLYK